MISTQVLATPAALARWLPQNAAVFDVLALDDVDLLKPHEVAAARARVAGAAVLSAGEAAPAGADASRLRGRYRGAALPPAVDVRPVDGAGRRATAPLSARYRRCGTTLGAVADVVGDCVGRRLSEADYGVAAHGAKDVGVAFRSLRGARVHAGFAAAAVECLRRSASQLAAAGAPRNAALVVAPDGPTARLVAVLVDVVRAADATFFADVDVRDARNRDAACLGAPDVAVVACPPNAKPAVRRFCDAAAGAARFASVRFAAAQRGGEDDGGDGGGAGPPPAWVSDVLRDVSALADAPMHDCRALDVGAGRWAIANYDALVLCGCGGADDAVALPRALEAYGWRRVLHLGAPPAGARVPARALLNDLCRWRHALAVVGGALDGDAVSADVAVVGPCVETNHWFGWS